MSKAAQAEIEPEEHTSFSKFGKSFQEDLCHLILEDRPFADQILEIFNVEYLESKYLQVFIQKITNYREKYKIHPNHKVLTMILKSELELENDIIKHQVIQYSSHIFGKGDVANKEYIKDVALQFCKKQKLKETIIKSAAMINKDSVQYDDIAVMLQETLKLGLDRNNGHEYLTDFEKRYERKARNPVSTGWPKIDELMQGGLGKGELGVIVAPTGAGKSHVLTHLGAHAIKSGKNVVHVTLELSDTTIGLRYDSCITGISLNELFSYKDLILETVKSVPGKLTIREYPTKSASLLTIKSYLDKLISMGEQIDFLIVDYGDILKPVTKSKEKRFELSDIYEGLRALAQEYSVPVYTASQTNRNFINEEVITLDSISEAFSKCFIADFICTISRTNKDKQENTARMFVAKNRFGIDGIVLPMKFDTSKVLLEILDEKYDEGSRQQEKKDDLSRKYADYINAKNKNGGK